MTPKRRRSRQRGKSGMSRRKALIGGGLVVTGGGILLGGSGAFSQTIGERATNVDTAGDADALLAITDEDGEPIDEDETYGAPQTLMFANNSSEELSVEVVLDSEEFAVDERDFLLQPETQLDVEITADGDGEVVFDEPGTATFTVPGGDATLDVTASGESVSIDLDRTIALSPEEITIRGWGAGGAGGGSTSTVFVGANGGGGGGGGAFAESEIFVEPGEELTVDVGSGGDGVGGARGSDGDPSAVQHHGTILWDAAGGEGGEPDVNTGYEIQSEGGEDGAGDEGGAGGDPLTELGTEGSGNSGSPPGGGGGGARTSFSFFGGNNDQPGGSGARGEVRISWSEDDDN